MSPLYPALICDRSAGSTPSAVRIASSVAPFAPFIAIPSDIDALKGDTNTFRPACDRANCRKSANENSLAATRVCCSDDVSARGSLVNGPVESEHATASRGTTNSDRQVSVIKRSGTESSEHNSVRAPQATLARLAEKTAW